MGFGEPRHLRAGVHDDAAKGLPPRPPPRPRDPHVDREHAHAVAIIWAFGVSAAVAGASGRVSIGMNDGSRASSALGGLALLATLVLLAGGAGAQAPR